MCAGTASAPSAQGEGDISKAIPCTSPKASHHTELSVKVAPQTVLGPIGDIPVQFWQAGVLLSWKYYLSRAKFVMLDAEYRSLWP